MANNLKKEAIMKRTMFFLVSFIIIFSITIISYAAHERIQPFAYKHAGDHYDRMPIPAGGDLRHHMAGHHNYTDWATWPGKDKQYKGTEPHGALLSTYINGIAASSIKAKKGMANNSIIVKENYAPNGELMAVTAMYKVKGYNPAGGDWFWVKYNADLTEIFAEGQPKGCVQCHGTVEGNDHVFTGDVTGGAKPKAGGY